MMRDEINLGEIKVSKLFRLYFIPTLLGMLSLCAVTAADGIFVGRGIGSDALAAVNICVAPLMALIGVGLMLGVGASVVSSIHLAKNSVKAARINMTQAMIAGTFCVLVFLGICLPSPDATGMALGSSESLLPLVREYLPWIFLTVLFQIWGAIGLFLVRLDGSPRYAMWCNVLPGLLNILLDWIFIFPLDMGLRGAGIATCISCFIGGMMVLVYMGWFADKLRFIRIKFSLMSLRLTLRNLGYQCKVGISALLGEATMGVMMLMGNLVFMEYLGNDGVGAFSIACYYCPFAFMIGNAIAQSAQPIISYNYGMSSKRRVVATERLAIISAVICGTLVMVSFIFLAEPMVRLFLDMDNYAAEIAMCGFPYFSAAFVFFIFNLTAIGYFQSVERVWPAIIFALLRGVVFLVSSFIVIPLWFGIKGIWLSLGVSEFTTSVIIVAYYFYCRNSKSEVLIEKPLR